MQDSLIAAGKDLFLPSELDDLRSIIRLTMEFFDYLQGGNPELGLRDYDTRYRCDSIFSGVESFCLVSYAYDILPGALGTTLDHVITSEDRLRTEFLAKYDQFLLDNSFEMRCRLVLDLFKLQIIFAGLMY
ncbi:MAG TPA: hypothetical protein VG297_26505 [Bryobacteraceae bacterium]|jgi:hypothetical protein|nr:hypothetical protein [Bryobacteraceae bacterium]